METTSKHTTCPALHLTHAPTPVCECAKLEAFRQTMTDWSQSHRGDLNLLHDTAEFAWNAMDWSCSDGQLVIDLGLKEPPAPTHLMAIAADFVTDWVLQTVNMDYAGPKLD